MPEKRDILEVLTTEFELDVTNLDDHNKVITVIGEIMSRYGIISNKQLLFAVKYETICKFRFAKLFTREAIIRYNIAGYTKTELQKINSGEKVGRIIGDKFEADENNYLYVVTFKDGKETNRVQLTDGNILIFNTFDEWEIFETIDDAKQYYDVQL